MGILLAALFGTIGFFASSVAAQQAVPSGTIQTFPAGENPWGLAFDGENAPATARFWAPFPSPEMVPRG
jgi:hypothetical protein